MYNNPTQNDIGIMLSKLPIYSNKNVIVEHYSDQGQLTVKGSPHNATLFRQSRVDFFS